MSERLRGDGRVFKGTEFVADIRYEIQVTSRYKTTRTINSVTRVLLGRDIRLRISPTDFIVKLLGERLTLHLEGSRGLDFVVISPAGDCAASGDLYKSGRLQSFGTPRRHQSFLTFGWC
jgi:hypothetical protein